MKFTAIAAFAAATFVAPALAQDAASLAALLPSCAVSCALTAIGPTGCAATDVSCLCASSSFVSSIAACTKNSCSPADQQKTAAATVQICPNLAGAAAAAGASGSSSAAVVSSAVASVVSSAVSKVSSSASAVAATTTVRPVAPIASGNATINGTAAATSSKPASYTGSAASVQVGMGLLAIMGFAAL